MLRDYSRIPISFPSRRQRRFPVILFPGTRPSVDPSASQGETMAQSAPKKIAVLGGGISGLTTVAELTSQPNWQQQYDITVYQMGWRLGGKGASGRNMQHAKRIEEHGYHMWFGFYDNAFRLMRNMYSENARPLEMPMATWTEAFKPVDYWVIMEHVADKWVNWPLEFRANPLTPGDNLPRPTILELSGRAFRSMAELLQSLHQTDAANVDDDDLTTAKYILKPETFMQAIGDRFREARKAFDQGVLGLALYDAIDHFERIISGDGDPVEHENKIVQLLDAHFEKVKTAIQDRLEKDMEARRLWILTDLLASSLRGMIRDGVIQKNSFDVINEWDFRDWLRRNGATDFTLRSPLVQGVYALVFCGDWYTYEAGTALRSTLELLLNYKGSVYWKMQAGMGDVVIAPIYEVLKKRGVKFKFFNRVKNLTVAADGKSIDSIEIGQQVTLKAGDYDPLVTVRGLPCWPSEPLYDQIVEGPQLQEGKVNLELSWTNWQDAGTTILHAGEDFDQIVLAISINALPYICSEIIAAQPKWQAMLQNVKAIPTMGIQLWMHPDIAGLGNPMWRNEICMVSTYVEPCDTWADKSDIIIRESWPDEHTPNSIAYLTGPMKPDVVLQPFTDTGFPEAAKQIVKGYAQDFLENHATPLWSHWVDPLTLLPRWQLLVDPENRVGVDRLTGQYFRANIEPTEHYVLSVTGSSKYRLAADESGYDNLVITGDWTKNPINAGCIEAAVMSGMLSAQAVQGNPLVLQNDPLGPISLTSANRASPNNPSNNTNAPSSVSANSSTGTE
jgi:uncharacterized protein with NAD-binding domain and iron-sulfur cluster